MIHLNSNLMLRSFFNKLKHFEVKRSGIGNSPFLESISPKRSGTRVCAKRRLLNTGEQEAQCNTDKDVKSSFKFELCKARLERTKDVTPRCAYMIGYCHYFFVAIIRLCFDSLAPTQVLIIAE